MTIKSQSNEPAAPQIDIVRSQSQDSHEEHIIALSRDMSLTSQLMELAKQPISFC